MNPKRAILDVDGILWALTAPPGPVAVALHKKYRVPLVEPTHWNFHQDFCTDEQFMALVNEAHAMQIAFPPFEGAKQLMEVLDQKGYEVVIASHRIKQTAHTLQKWLNKYELQPYSGVYCGSSKHFLIGVNDLVIDDSPATIEFAQKGGAQVLSLKYAYNAQAMQGLNNGTPNPVGFDNLEEIATWIRAH